MSTTRIQWKKRIPKRIIVNLTLLAKSVKES